MAIPVSAHMQQAGCRKPDASFTAHLPSPLTRPSSGTPAAAATSTAPLQRRRRGVLVVTASWPSLDRQPAPNRLFVFGLGYTGLGAASYFLKRGWHVAGTCRSPEKRQQLEERGITAYHFDPADFEMLGGKGLESLRHATHVLSTVPPDANADEEDPVILAHSQQLSERADRYKWVGYISSTSVYGDYEGEWVNEGSELRAAGGKGWARIVAEHEWLALQNSFGLPVHIFRCGGIYGPRRSAIETVQKEWGAAEGGPQQQWRPSASQEWRGRQRFTARCHVYDICQALEASTKHPRPGAAYNIADDDPADRATVMQYAAELLERSAAGLPLNGWAAGSSDNGGWDGDSGREMVGNGLGSTTAGSSGSFDSGDETASGSAWRAVGTARERPRSRRDRDAAAAATRTTEEKRVSNTRIKQELGVRLLYPTYREGLAAIAAGDLRPYN